MPPLPSPLVRAGLVSALLILALSTGCPQGLLPCRAAEDCPALSVCVNGTCVASCDRDKDCTGGQQCIDGLCAAEGEGEGEGGAGEGEGEGEGEGGAGEGEGEGGAGEGEGEGEGEGGAGEGEGEGGAGEGEGEGEGAAATCGNGVVEAPETCDDHNTAAGDGCSSSCAVEPGFICVAAPVASRCGEAPIPDPCVQDLLHSDINGDCFPDFVVAAPGSGAEIGYMQVFIGNLQGQLQKLGGDFTFDGVTAGPFGGFLVEESGPGDDRQRGITIGGAGGPATAQFVVDQTGTITAGVYNDAGGGFAAAISLETGSRHEAPTVFGRGSKLFFVAAPPGAGATVETNVDVLDLATLNISGASIAALALANDVDGDGLRDIAVGIPGADVGGQAVGVVVISTLKRTVVETIANNAVSFGATLFNVGDFDGDGSPDLGVGAPDAGKGKAFIVRTSGPVLEVRALTRTVDGAAFGHAMASVGDVDGDGNDDVLVGAPFDASAVATPNEVAECDTMRGRAVSGDCTGSVGLVLSAGLTNAVTLADVVVCATLALPDTSDGGRLGMALRGVVPGVAVVGAGGLESTQPGEMDIFALAVSGTGVCTATSNGALLGTATGRDYGTVMAPLP